MIVKGFPEDFFACLGYNTAYNGTSRIGNVNQPSFASRDAVPSGACSIIARLADVTQTNEPSLELDGCILLVEDEDGIRETVRFYLQAHGIEVVCAKSGADALLQLADLQGQKLAVVVTDMVMPDMGGLTLAESMKSNGWECGYVFMSGHTDQQTKFDPKLEPDICYLQKPFKLAELAKAIRQVSNRQLKERIGPMLSDHLTPRD